MLSPWFDDDDDVYFYSYFIPQLNNKSSAIGLQKNCMKSKFLRSEYVPQNRIVMGKDEIKEVKESVNLGRMVNMYRDMWGEISRRIKSGWKPFNTIKDKTWQ